MAQKKGSILRIKDPIYNADTIIVYNCSQIDGVLAMESFLPKDHRINVGNRDLDGYTISACGMHFLWLRRFHGTTEDYAVLVHEMMHHVEKVLVSRSGMQLSLDSSEAFAYYMEFWMREFLKGYKQLEKKRRKNVQKKKAA